MIKTFAANRPAGDEQHRLRIDSRVSTTCCTAPTAPPGSASPPAAANLTLDLLRDAGLAPWNARTRCERCRQHRDCGRPPTRTHYSAQDALFGQVVCACEHVSAAEIDRGAVRPVPATSVDGVRKRTGAAYGRCQGSLCSAGDLVHDRDGHRHRPGHGAADQSRDGRVITMAPFLVVGAGPSGLGCAWELAGHGDVVVFDRIPVTGGSAGWTGPTMRRLTDRVTSRGVRLQLGQTAMRFDGAALTVATPTGFQHSTADN